MIKFETLKIILEQMKLKLLFALLVFQFGFAQHRTCGRQELIEQTMKDPVQKQAYLERQNKIQLELQRLETNKSAASTNDIVRIPVAIHFPLVSNANTAETKACFINLAQSQINALNADYNAANADISNWVNDAVNYPMVSALGNLSMQFALATQNHPAGSGVAEGTVAVTFGTAFLNAPNPDLNWAGYLNIVVRTLPSGYVGLTPKLGASPAAGDCTFIAPYAFGTVPGCGTYGQGGSFTLGRTTTHELGHYFQLEHPFNGGCAATNCSTMGDYVCDTPQIAEPTLSTNGVCPSLVPGCVSGEYALSMNFMDYADDKCMYMFTKQQENRARAWYNTIASEFKTNVLANDAFLQNKFSVYPNPSKGSFTIEFKDFMSNYAVEVFDVTGNVVYENNFNQSSGLLQVVNLENVTTGIYFVNIKSDQGIVTKKLVVQ